MGWFIPSKMNLVKTFEQMRRSFPASSRLYLVYHMMIPIRKRSDER
jgi:hypothetical protein